MPIYEQRHMDAYEGHLDNDRAGELNFIRAHAERTDGPILYLASGAARLMRWLARDGYNMYGVEASDLMLKMADETTRRLPPPVRARMRWQKADMRDFETAPWGWPRTFPLVIVPFHSFWYNLDESGAQRCLDRIAAHTAPGGTFLIDSAVGKNAERAGAPDPSWWDAAARIYQFSYELHAYDPHDVPGSPKDWTMLVATTAPSS